MSIKLKDTIYDLINNSDKLDGFDSSAFSLTTHTHSGYLTSLPTHTHNYASTVKVGSTSYNVSNNIISLPAYPTLSSLGGAASSHSHDYLPLSGGTMTGTLTAKSGGLVVNSDGGDTDTTRALKYYNTAITFASMNVGYSASKGNAAEYAFSFISSASTSNFASIGFYGGNRLRLYYNGGSGVGRATLTSDNATSPEAEHTILTSGNWSSYVTSGGFNGGTITENLVIAKANPLCLGSYSNGDATIYSSKASSWMRVYSNTASILFETLPYDATVETNATRNREMILFRNHATNSYHFCLNMPASYSASSTTATPDSLFFCNGTARIATRLRIGSGLEAAEQRYISCTGKTGASYINWGYSDTAGNTGELTFSYVSSASSSNMVGIGFHSKNCIACYYDGRVNIPGTLQIGGESITFTT